jgi:hypothetical protein
LFVSLLGRGLGRTDLERLSIQVQQGIDLKARVFS